jgi:8-hydroxy-5-deazaflavin:NADPH oxidoreductase
VTCGAYGLPAFKPKYRSAILGASGVFSYPLITLENIMSIGIIGSGALGSNLARILAKNGIAATIANSRGPESLADFVAEVGSSIEAGTVGEAASADIVIDSTNPVEFLDPDSPDAKDPSNPLAAYGIKAVDLGGKFSSEVFKQYVPGARVVRAFNHLVVTTLQEPKVSGGQRVLFYSGDDVDAKTQVRKIIDGTGFFPVDLGTLEVGGPMASLPFGSLAAHNFIKI